ncbi:hypothetical protein EJB05_16227, partial [Eragrostis curvula]
MAERPEIVEELLDWFCRQPAAVSLSAAVVAALAAPADGVDRISALPDDILRNIVSRLPVRDAARIDALASRWRGLWRSAPIVLHAADLLASSSDEHVRAAAASIGRVLADHHGPFRGVYITSFPLAPLENELVEWSRLLATKGVQDLAVHDKSGRTNWGPRVPMDILRSTSLRRLFVGCRSFPFSGPDCQLDTDIAFPHLQELLTFASYISDKNLARVLARSPKLETLALRINLCNQSLQCMILWWFTAEELTVVDAPCLKRLILWKTGNSFGLGDGLPLTVKIDNAPELRVLGYLDPRHHKLQIGNIVIKAETKASPSSTVPSVKILALKVDFSVLMEVNMLCSFLGCFPNIDTLHIQSNVAGEATDWHPAKFWGEVGPIECVKSHVKKIVINEFQGQQSELDFLKFIVKCSPKLQTLQLVLTRGKNVSAEELNEMNCQLVGALGTCTWAAEDCKVELLPGYGAENAGRFRKASDLSLKNPFI